MENKPKYSIRFNMIYLTEKNVRFNQRYSSKYCILYTTQINRNANVYNKEGLSDVIEWYREKYKIESSTPALKYKILFKGSDNEVMDRLLKIKQKNFCLRNCLFYIGEILAVLKGEENE